MMLCPTCGTSNELTVKSDDHLDRKKHIFLDHFVVGLDCWSYCSQCIKDRNLVRKTFSTTVFMLEPKASRVNARLAKLAAELAAA